MMNTAREAYDLHKRLHTHWNVVFAESAISDRVEQFVRENKVNFRSSVFRGGKRFVVEPPADPVLRSTLRETFKDVKGTIIVVEMVLDRENVGLDEIMCLAELNG